MRGKNERKNLNVVSLKKKIIRKKHSVGNGPSKKIIYPIDKIDICVPDNAVPK